ncbi:MAG: UDP-N-acetylmuramoyl-L-alanine--D-glutamate ligase [Pseudomonadota bacterium]
MKIADLAGKKVAILGAGVEGRAALTAIGSRIGYEQLTLLDEKTLDPHVEAATRWGPLAELELEHFDVVIRSPGFSVYRPELVAARQAGVRFSSGTELWLAEGPGAPVLAVTGTKGKSTTSSLVTHLLTAAGLTARLGGNIGQPLLSFLDLKDQHKLPGWFVVELSSYQIVDLAGSVEIAVLTNLLADHLDWHGSLAQYHRDKRRLLAMASRGTVAHESARAALAGQGVSEWAGSDASWQVRGSEVRRAGKKIGELAGWRLPGRHNLDNLEVALAAAAVAGADVEASLAEIRNFDPLPHRLQPVPSVRRPRCINDSIATTPDATIAAIRCFSEEPLVLIVGGFERQQDWAGLARELEAAPVTEVIVQGEGAERLSATLASLAPSQKHRRCSDLAAAVALALLSCDEGGVILLSPGAPSFDQFADFKERGETFIRLCQVR